MAQVYGAIELFLKKTLGFAEISITENDYLRNEAIYVLTQILKNKKLELNQIETHEFLEKKISLERYIERIEAMFGYKVNGYHRRDVSGEEYVIIEEKTLYFDTINDCSGIGEQLMQLHCVKVQEANEHIKD